MACSGCTRSKVQTHPVMEQQAQRAKQSIKPTIGQKMTALQALIEVIGTIAKHRVSHFAYNGEVKSYAHMQAELLKAQQEEVDKISQLTVDALLKELHAIQEVK